MLPLKCAPEPVSFDTKVRQKGLSAIDELVGRSPRVAHRGPKQKKVAFREEDIPASAFPPYWRDALGDMVESYESRCAFLAMHIDPATGAPSIDHMIPKSRSWKDVYEWKNYRLSAALINARKRDLTGIIDPFVCKEGWFALELVGFQVVRGHRAPTNRLKELDATLELLNAPECCRQRAEYVDAYEKGEITLAYLRRRAPFVASELERQRRPVSSESATIRTTRSPAAGVRRSKPSARRS